MKIKNDVNFFDYVSMEEHNLLVSLHNFRNEFNVFGRVTDLYSVGDLEVPFAHGITMKLFCFIRNHLLFSTATLLRCHMAEASNSVRIAIDAALIAYRIIEGHGTEEEYIEGTNSFDQTPRYIKNKRRDDPNFFPLADHLLNMHSLFSKTASHADFDVFMHRLKFQQVAKGKMQLQLGLFQYAEDPDEFRLFFLAYLHTYVLMAEIFEGFLTDTIKTVSSNWGKQLRALGAEIEQRRDAARSAFEAKQTH